MGERARAAALIGAFVLMPCATGCGTDQAASEAAATSLAPTTSNVASEVSITTVPAVSAPEGTPTQTYAVVAGDTLSGIAKSHCTTLDVVIAVNGWADGANHAIFPADTILVPAAPCEKSDPVGSTIGTITTGGGSVTGETYYSLWGDPSDYGAIYDSPQCTELRAAGNNLTAEYGFAENPEPARRFLAAVAAMPNPPSAEVQAAIESTVDLYTRYAPVWAQVESEATGGLGVADNPVWTDAWAAIEAGSAEREEMWAYVAETCPAIDNSED